MFQSQTIQVVPDLVQVNRVHRNDYIRSILLQKLGSDNQLTASWQVFALAVGVNVYDELDFVLDTDRIEERDALRTGSPDHATLAVVADAFNLLLPATNRFRIVT